MKKRYVSSYLKQKFIKELFKSICYAGTGCCLEFMNTCLDIGLLDMKKKNPCRRFFIVKLTNNEFNTLDLSFKIRQ